MPAQIKPALLKLAAPLARGARLQAGMVLCFHAVRDRSEDLFLQGDGRLSITAGFLEALVTKLADRGYDFIALDDLLPRLRTGPARPFVALTFDDGYLDMATTVLPLLRRRGIPFAVFVTTGFVDGTAVMWWEGLLGMIAAHDALVLPEGSLPTATPDEKRAAFGRLAGRLMHEPPARQRAQLAALLDDNPSPAARSRLSGLTLSWADIRALAASGLATIGCHTVSHPALRRLGDAEARHEVFFARDRLAAELGTPPRHFAYPYGGPAEVGPREWALVREAGFATAVTTTNALLRRGGEPDPFRLPRLPYDARFEDASLIEAYATGVPAAMRAMGRRLRPS